ncbi:hypothetical protein PLICRDRAFT_180983 [Plicaturopsis crispa FD-325 SS-3]|uniref:Uncharacterized protein n=1 Tax=Plicaturopsis crispa FD-325 SS-3 TaxID=944288 RepID=A0A0C9T103_PLICR|nr:hypothetical protein PLICRDRAFT_180983 [Plicaturopsis crispa FD-325 SS-3]
MLFSRSLPNSQCAFSDLKYFAKSDSRVTKQRYAGFQNAHEWLVVHGVIQLDHEKNHGVLQAKMAQCCHGPRNMVNGAWSDSQLKEWLVLYT